jgi:hypothetical protein
MGVFTVLCPEAGTKAAKSGAGAMASDQKLVFSLRTMSEPEGGPVNRSDPCPNVTGFKQFANGTHCQKSLNLTATVGKLFRFSEYQDTMT